MMILSTIIKMLKTLIKSIILSFQPLRAVGKEADFHIKIKSLDFYYFYVYNNNRKREVISQLLSKVITKSALVQRTYSLYRIRF